MALSDRLCTVKIPFLCAPFVSLLIETLTTNHIWLVVSNMFYVPFHIWECHHPDWRTHLFSRWLSHHQPGWRQTIDWCFQVQRIHGTAPDPLLCPGSLSKRRRFCSSARWMWHRRTSLDGYVWCLVDGDVRLQGATPYLAQLLQLSGWILGCVFFLPNTIEVHGGYIIVIYQEIWLGRIDPL